MASLCDQTPQSAMDTAVLFASAAEEVDDVPINGADTDSTDVKVLDKTGLVEPDAEQFEILVDRLQMRLRDGRGECIYEVGVAEHSDEAGPSFLFLHSSRTTTDTARC